MYSWPKGPVLRKTSVCVPGEPTFTKTSPQNLWNRVRIPSSRYLRHDCICCSASPPIIPPPTHPLALQPSGVRQSARSARPLGGVERCLAAARSAPLLHSLQTAPSGSSRHGNAGASAAAERRNKSGKSAASRKDAAFSPAQEELLPNRSAKVRLSTSVNSITGWNLFSSTAPPGG